MAEDQEEKQGFSIARLEQFQNFPKWQIALFDRIAALFLFLIILIVFGTLIGLLITFLDFGSDEAKITAESFNKILLGIGAVLAVPFLVWRTMIAQDQNKIAQENTHSTTMAKAVEQLGAMKEEKLDDVSVTKPNIEVRLGAIYLLEKLAREHEQLHWPIMEILCAYIRENCDKLNPPSVEIQIAYATMNFDEESEYLINNRQIDGPRVDIQAALIVIGRRSEQQRDWERKLRKKSHHKLNYRLDLNSCQLAKMTFRGLNFEYAIFDNCCFERSSFINVELNNAKMGDIHFEGGLIQDSNLSNTNLNWASFHGAKIERKYN
ncbi:MAG: pentapeptide repeat-containing protein, partial [Hyphomicrobiales bacterium]